MVTEGKLPNRIRIIPLKASVTADGEVATHEGEPTGVKPCLLMNMSEQEQISTLGELLSEAFRLTMLETESDLVHPSIVQVASGGRIPPGLKEGDRLETMSVSHRPHPYGGTGFISAVCRKIKG